MQVDKISKIKEAFSGIYLVKQDEIEAIIGKVQNLPDEAFDDVMKVAETAKGNQLAFLRSCVLRDKNFTNDFKHFMAQSYTKATQSMSEDEQNSADQILDKL